MRKLALALLIALPAAAQAQTAADVAHQLWPTGVVPYASTSAPPAPVRPTAFGPADIVRQFYPLGDAPAVHSRAPEGFAGAGGFTVADLERLRGVETVPAVSDRPLLAAGHHVMAGR